MVHYQRSRGEVFWELKTCSSEWHSRRAHSHAEWSAGLVESGECVLGCAGQSMPVVAPALVWFSPETVHECQPLKTSDWAFRMVYWPAPGEPGDWGVRELDAQGYFLWKTFFDALGQGNPKLAPAWLWEHGFGKLGQEISPQSVSAGPLSGLRRPDRPYKKFHGLAPTQHRTVLRLRYAQKLLREGVAPAQAALEAGFYDQSQFTRSFRVLTGTTPGKYLQP